jgi:hypothetical protein
MQTIEKRLTSAHGNTRVARIFANEWPRKKLALRSLSVAVARRAVLGKEIAEATGLGLQKVRKRLRIAKDRTSLKGVFPELTQKHPKAERRAEEIANDRAVYSRWPRYSRGRARFSTTELLGEVRTISIRNAPIFLDWFAAVVQLERRSVQQMLRAWHGHGNVRRVFSQHWPADVQTVPGGVLGAFKADAARMSPALVRLVADVCDLEPQRVRDRLMGARRNARTDDVVPELLRLR